MFKAALEVVGKRWGSFAQGAGMEGRCYGSHDESVNSAEDWEWFIGVFRDWEMVSPYPRKAPRMGRIQRGGFGGGREGKRSYAGGYIKPTDGSEDRSAGNGDGWRGCGMTQKVSGMRCEKKVLIWKRN